MKQLYSKHFGRAVVYTLLALFLCVAGAGKAAADVDFTYKPQVKVISTNYTNSGTEVTLKLWMYNLAGGSSRFIKNRTVDLYIDDQPQSSLLLNNLWQKISNAEEYEMRNSLTSGPVGNKENISFNYKNIGTAQFSNLQIYQYSENDGKGTQTARWCTIELKLSFDNTFSYYGHKISVRGLWQDNSGAYPITEYVSLDNTIGGYVRPTKLKVWSVDSRKMRLSWEIQDYNGLASKEGNWIIYKCENGKRERVGSKGYNYYFSYDIYKEKYNCSATYDVTFQPRQFTASDTICGLTTSVAATGHQPNADDICQYCNHSFFRYTTSDGKIVNNINNPGQFGANIVAHSVVDGKCVIEFDAPITKIPANAFYNKNSLTGDLVIPNSVTEIGERAFENCTGLNGTLTLSNKLETIGVLAFRGCSGFTGSLTLPSSVTTIGQSAFSTCRSFTKLELPNTLSVISTQAFMDCRSLSGELVIPASVTEIGYHAFDGCINLSAEKGQVTLPKSLKKIGSEVFNSINNINTINFQSLPEGISEYLGYNKKAVSLSDESYISDQASGTVDEISYTRKMSNDWGTLVLPYSLTLTGEESYRLYAIDKIDGNELVLSRIEGTVAAGTPCVVKRNGTETDLTFGANDAELNMAISDQNVGGMTFHGTYTTKEVNSGYVISKDCFWNVAELMSSNHVKGAKVSPFRAWLDGNAASGPARLAMRIDGSTTGINTPDTLDALNDAEAEYYDLSGKRLHEPQKGVNIVRMKSGKTKKIIIK